MLICPCGGKTKLKFQGGTENSDIVDLKKKNSNIDIVFIIWQNLFYQSKTSAGYTLYSGRNLKTCVLKDWRVVKSRQKLEWCLQLAEGSHIEFSVLTTFHLRADLSQHQAGLPKLGGNISTGLFISSKME